MRVSIGFGKVGSMGLFLFWLSIACVVFSEQWEVTIIAAGLWAGIISYNQWGRKHGNRD